MINHTHKSRKLLQLWIAFGFFLLLWLGLLPVQAEDPIVIEYWQPNLGNASMKSRIEGMDILIAEFESLHPDIRVVHNFAVRSNPNRYEPEVGLALRDGTGPDIVTLFNGWIPAWISAGYLIPLPEDFYTDTYIQENFYPIVSSSRYDEHYWALPTAVRTMALFYNRDYFAAAGIPEPGPEWTWDNFEQAATQLNGIEPGVVGFDWELNGWGHHWLREVLVPQFGGESYVNNPNRSIWGSAAACEAFTWALGLMAKPRSMVEQPANGVGIYFETGQTAMHVDGSFRIGTIASRAPDLNYGIAPLPVMMRDGQPVPRTFGSYWTHGLTPRVLEDKRRYEASIAFLNYISSPHAGLVWSSLNTELPAQRAAATEAIAANPLIEPFIRSLDFSYATPFVNEAQQRNFLSSAYDSVLLNGADPCDALREVDRQEQELIEDFVENRERWELGAELIPIGLR
jgi:multiple sugar transport system substrate-binding protein